MDQTDRSNLTAFQCVYGIESEAAALREIINLLPALSVARVLDLLPAIASACEDQSEIEGDDFELAAQRIDECAESLRDELGDEIGGVTECRR